MKLDVPALADAADTVELVRRDGIRVFHYVAPPVVNALHLIGVGIVLLAFAVAFAGNGSKVAGQKGGARGR